MKKKVFPNGFDEWMETHYEIVQAITLMLYDEDIDEDGILYKRYDEQGTSGMYMLSEELTDAFEEEYEGAEWGEELDYYDTLELFLNTRI
jgi:hypothetical protein